MYDVVGSGLTIAVLATGLLYTQLAGTGDEVGSPMFVRVWGLGFRAGFGVSGRLGFGVEAGLGFWGLGF